MDMYWECTPEMHQRDREKDYPFLPLYNPDCILHFEGSLRIPDTPSKKMLEESRGERFTEWEYREFLKSFTSHAVNKSFYRYPLRAFRVIQSEQEARVA